MRLLQRGDKDKTVVMGKLRQIKFTVALFCKQCYRGSDPVRKNLRKMKIITAVTTPEKSIITSEMSEARPGVNAVSLVADSGQKPYGKCTGIKGAASCENRTQCFDRSAPSIKIQ